VTRISYKVGIGFLLVYLIGGILINISIETTLNGGMDISLKYLSIPLAIIIFGYTAMTRNEAIARNPKASPWVMACILYPLCVLFTSPYIVALNAAGMPKQEIIFRGPIIRKWYSSGKSTSYHVEIMDSASNKKVSFYISKTLYNSVHEGDSYTKKMYLGRFGIPYRWKWE
jgi:hypothetical protein